MIRRKKFASGLTLLTESIPHVRSVCVGVWLRRGSRHEAARVNGISHFIEHLVFKGTRNRSARDIALQMDSVGGQMDAFTSKEYTCFYAKVLDEHLDVAVNLLADIVQNPLFDADEVERERKVVLEEIQMVDDTPDDLIYDLFASHFYPGHVLGRPIQGTAESVGGLTRRQLMSFFRNAYRPENMLIVATGDVDHGRLSRKIGRAFGNLERGSRGLRHQALPRPHGGLVTRSRKELAQLHLLMGLPAFPDRGTRRYPLYVFNTLLGGTMSSRLFQRIREERGLVYSVYSAVNGFVDAGFLAIYAATSPQKGPEVLEVVQEELRDLRDNGPTAEELRVAKEHLKGSLMLSLESTSSRMSNVARQEIYYGRQFTMEETLAGVESVDRDQVQDIARHIVADREMSVAAVGKIGSIKRLSGALKL
ncbi:MAG: insulinase family protein [Acidobacteriota bacterium]|nr:insulinase family protein [Acidobacteriota bacterium]